MGVESTLAGIAAIFQESGLADALGASPLSALAVLFGIPTAFGPADLCERCAERYSNYIRRRKRKPPNETSGPTMAARFPNLNPSAERFNRDEFQSNKFQ